MSEKILEEFKTQMIIILDPNIDPESPNPDFPRLHPCDRLGRRLVDMGVPTVYFGKGVKDEATIRGKPPKLEVTYKQPVQYVQMGRGRHGAKVLWPGEHTYYRIVIPVLKREGESTVIVLNDEQDILWKQRFEEHVSGSVVREGVAVVLRKDAKLKIEWQSNNLHGFTTISPKGEIEMLEKE